MMTTSRGTEEPEDLLPEEMEELSERLSKLKAEVEADIRQAKEEARPVDLGLEIGRITRGDAIQAQQMAAARLRRLEEQLAMVKAAQSRIASGTFGECLRCELPVGYARLQARPEAPFCARCQGAR